MTAPVIELSIGERTLAHVIAALRQGVNRTAGLKNLKAGPQDPLLTDVVGLKGELAFAKWANVYPDLSIHLRSGSFDATWNGWSVDVKSTRNPNGPLWLDERKRPDVYVLAVVREEDVTLVGWLAGQVAHETGRKQLQQDELHPMDRTPTTRANDD